MRATDRARRLGLAGDASGLAGHLEGAMQGKGTSVLILMKHCIAASPTRWVVSSQQIRCRGCEPHLSARHL